jgi:hypothetical protein
VESIAFDGLKTSDEDVVGGEHCTGKPKACSRNIMGQGRNHQPGGGGNRMATASKKSKGKAQSSKFKCETR